MSAYLGDFLAGAVVRKMWNSSGADGASITRGTNGTISVYKDGNTTQVTTGVTDTEDFDSLTGVHLVAVDTGSDGTFYAAGHEFEVVLSAASIDGKTVNATLFSFSIQNRMAASVYSRVGAPAGASVSADIVTVAGYIDTEVAAIKAKTDQLNFTSSNKVQADIKAINGTAVAGNGSGTPWGP